MFVEFLEELKQKEIKISFSEGKILYSGPEENITSELIGKLKAFKKDLIKHFWPRECKNLMSFNSEGSKPPFILMECPNLSYLLSNYFGLDQPVYGFHNNAWSTGEKSVLNSVESLAKEYIDQLKKVLPNGPYFLGGHSFGGILAYEMAVQLQKSGNEVPFLTLFDTMSPYPFKSINWHSNKLNIYKIIYDMIVRRLWHFIKMSVYNSFFLIKKSFPKPLLRNYIVTNYSMLVKKYRPEKLNVNILLFKASKDNSFYKCDYGWEDFVNKITIVNIGGTHLSIFKGIDNAEIIGKEIEKYLTGIRKNK